MSDNKFDLAMSIAKIFVVVFGVSAVMLLYIAFVIEIGR